ncbi:ORF6N domain-containing protein, partial [Salmonella enterica]|nr:ORF6N domain-containing protein [Salmonella enterica]
MNTITIQDTQLPVVEYRGLRVVTFSMIDDAHARPDGTASRVYRENRDRFIEGEDYFTVSTDEIRRDKFYPLSSMARGRVT